MRGSEPDLLWQKSRWSEDWVDQKSLLFLHRFRFISLCILSNNHNHSITSLSFLVQCVILVDYPNMRILRNSKNFHVRSDRRVGGQGNPEVKGPVMHRAKSFTCHVTCWPHVIWLAYQLCCWWTISLDEIKWLFASLVLWTSLNIPVPSLFVRNFVLSIVSLTLYKEVFKVVSFFLSRLKSCSLSNFYSLFRIEYILLNAW